MVNSTAVLIRDNVGMRDVVAAGARISTQEGTALSIFERSGDAQKDLKLISRVVASGHLSVLEHQTLNIAFNDVSVLVEQFVIEFRLASFTVKSRRYVNFTQAGYVLPQDLKAPVARAWSEAMERCFETYAALQELGVPREDARFVLPYALRSNFLVTVNLRELLHMIEAMRFGRGRALAEVRQLGEQLSTQVEQLYPGLCDALNNTKQAAGCAEALPVTPACGGEARAEVRLLSAVAAPQRMMEAAAAIGGSECMAPSRPRALELLHYGFEICNISLACLTHITRHRMLTPIIPDIAAVWRAGKHIVPDSVRAHDEALRRYTACFDNQAEALARCLALDMPAEHAAYFALSGMTIDILLDANARELKHFFALRTCSRAQWEIQDVAVQMLSLLVKDTPEIFASMGPSCAVRGACPEGRMSCGKPVGGYGELMQKREGKN